MFEDHNSTVYEIMLASNLIDKAQLDDLNQTHVDTGKPLADVIIGSGLIEKNDFLKAIADNLSYEYMPSVPSDIPQEVSKQIRAQVARMYGVVPLEYTDTTIKVLAMDPFNNSIVDDLTFSLNKDVSVVVADPAAVENLLKQIYGEEDSSIDELLSEISGVNFGEGDMSENDISNMANETPIIRFVNLVLQQAIRDKASDIHFEPFEDCFRIR